MQRLEWQPRILAFCCQHCAYAGADAAGQARLNYPANLRVALMPCSGRVDMRFVLRALEQGCDGVLILGCHEGGCHYGEGNLLAQSRLAELKSLLEYLGMEPERLQCQWVSAAEGAKFRDIAARFTADIRTLGPNTLFTGGESDD